LATRKKSKEQAGRGAAALAAGRVRRGYLIFYISYFAVEINKLK